MNIDDGFWLALDELVSKSGIIIDRPKGTRHPKYSDILYDVDYGYLKDTAERHFNNEKISMKTTVDA